MGRLFVVKVSGLIKFNEKSREGLFDCISVLLNLLYRWGMYWVGWLIVNMCGCFEYFFCFIFGYNEIRLIKVDELIFVY